MTVQELINQLLLIEDKTKLVVNEYDGWYNIYQSLATIDLYTSDDCTNLYDSIEESERMSDEGETCIVKHCILIDTSDGTTPYPKPQKYFYTNN
jgi:hypothetical protein